MWVGGHVTAGSTSDTPILYFPGKEGKSGLYIVRVSGGSPISYSPSRPIPDSPRVSRYSSLSDSPPVSHYSSPTSTSPLSGRATHIHSVSGGPFWIVGVIAAIFLFAIMFPLMLL